MYVLMYVDKMHREGEGEREREREREREKHLEALCVKVHAPQNVNPWFLTSVGFVLCAHITVYDLM
jgi:hypothetical protein